MKLNFRQAERQMPRDVQRQATEYMEYIHKMEAYLSTLDPEGKGVKSSEPPRQKPSLLGRVSTQQCVGIMLDHHDHRRSWHACSSSGASIPRIWPQSMAGAEQDPLLREQVGIVAPLKSWQSGWTSWDRHRLPYAAMENQL